MWSLQRLKKEESNKSDSSKEVGSLGLEISNLTPNLAENLGIPEDTQGVVVRGVKDNSPAARASLQPGDIVQRVGQTPVNSLEEFGDAIEKANSEKGILLYIRRGDSGAFVVLK